MQCHSYSAASKFKVLSDSANYLYLAVAKFAKWFFYSRQHPDNTWEISTRLVAGIYIVVKHLTKITVKLTVGIRPYSKENNNL